MKKLTVGEWVAVGIALLLALSIFMVGGIFQTGPGEGVADQGMPVPGSDTPEMVVEGDVLGDDTDVPDVDPTTGTFLEGEVPEDVTDEEATAM